MGIKTLIKKKAGLIHGLKLLRWLWRHTNGAQQLHGSSTTPQTSDVSRAPTRRGMETLVKLSRHEAVAVDHLKLLRPPCQQQVSGGSRRRVHQTPPLSSMARHIPA